MVAVLHILSDIIKNSISYPQRLIPLGARCIKYRLMTIWSVRNHLLFKPVLISRDKGFRCIYNLRSTPVWGFTLSFIDGITSYYKGIVSLQR